MKNRVCLTQNHRSDLLSEGFSEPEIEALTSQYGVRSLSEAEALDLGFKCWDGQQWRSSSGIYFPFTETFGQIRAETPIPRKQGKPAKYLTQAGAKTQAFIPEGCQATTEGFKDAIMATLRGVPTGAIAGVSHFKKALPKGCGYAIIFDSDGWSNPQVFRNLTKAGLWCGGKVLILPKMPDHPKGGICELYKSGQKLDLSQAVKPRELLEDWPNHWEGLPPQQIVKLAKAASKIAAEILPKDEAKAFNRRLKAAHKDSGLTIDTLDTVAKHARNESEPNSPTIAQKLIAIGLSTDLFHTPDEVAYADVVIDGARHTYPVRSASFKRWLARTLYTNDGSAANSEAMSAALNVLEGEAIFSGPEREVHLRTAKHDGSVYIDLCNAEWEAVKVSVDGQWQVVTAPPVRFARPATALPLPTPTRDGNLEDLRQLLNLDGESWTLLILFALHALTPSPTYPVLLLSACRGSGKTWAAEVLKRLTDPGKAPLVSISGDSHKMAVAGLKRHLLAYDNVSHISRDISDTLCRISTGFGFTTRTLHTTAEETVFDFARPQIITAIDHVVARDDLADRLLMVRLPEIEASDRKPKAQLERELEAILPGAFGALLDALAQTLRSQHLGLVTVKDPPRIADFGHFAIHAEPHLGLAEGAFSEAFDASRALSREVVLEASPLAEAIAALIERDGEAKGTASVLLKRLEEFAEEPVVRSRLWPKASNGFSRALNRLKPDLRAVGISVSDSREGKDRTRLICLSRIAGPDRGEKISSLSSAKRNEGPKPPLKAGFHADDMADDKRTILGLADDTCDGRRTILCEADDKRTILNSNIVRPKNQSQQALKDLADDTDDKFTLLSGHSARGIGKKFSTGTQAEFSTGKSEQMGLFPSAQGDSSQENIAPDGRRVFYREDF